MRIGLVVLTLAACSSKDASAPDLAMRELGPRPDLSGADCLARTPSTILFQGHCPEATPCFRDSQTPGY
jgi:hypothetical protein